MIDSNDFTSENVHVGIFAFGAALLVTVHTVSAIAFLGADAAAFHDLTAGRIW